VNLHAVRIVQLSLDLFEVSVVTIPAREALLHRFVGCAGYA